jgi:superfamily I DNA/RNA helicase
MADWGVKEFTQSGQIDFTDMLWIPLRMRYASANPFDVLFVDEAQDLSNAQRYVVSAYARWQGIDRNLASLVVVVGDPHQAIFGFAGADTDSFNRNVSVFNCEVYPLTFTRRCGQTISQHIRSQGHVPDFQSLPDAPMGEVVYTSTEDMYANIAIGDMVLCRTNAPLMGVLLNLIQKKIAVRVLGNDLASQFLKILNRVEGMRGFSYSHITDFINMDLMVRLSKTKDKRRAQSLADLYGGLSMLVESAPNMFTLKAKIKDYLGVKEDQDGANAVTLASAHRSKGLQANRVFIIKPHLMPLLYDGITDEELTQERNLKYVAETRAISMLVIVDDGATSDIPTYARRGFGVPVASAPNIQDRLNALDEAKRARLMALLAELEAQ